MESDELNERVKRRVYIPEDEDEYDAASKPLTGKSIFVHARLCAILLGYNDNAVLYYVELILDDTKTLPIAANDLKSGFISDVTM